MARQSGHKWSWKSFLKDGIIVALFGGFVIFEIYSYITKAENNISAVAILESVAPIAVSFVGLIENFRYLGWHIFVPDFMLHKQEQERMEALQQCMKAYFNNEVNFIHDYSEEKIGYILTQLNISTNQLDNMPSQLFRKCLAPYVGADHWDWRCECYSDNITQTIELFNQSREEDKRGVTD